MKNQLFHIRSRCKYGVRAQFTIKLTRSKFKVHNIPFPTIINTQLVGNGTKK